MSKGVVKEIEVKARVRNKKQLLDRLVKLGCKLSKPIAQMDIAYLEPGFKFEDIGPGVKALRIRKQNGKTLLTLKERQEIEMSSIEHETEVSDPFATEKLVKLLGYMEYVRINKKRIKTEYKELEICIDEVEDLGNFIEVEKMSDGDSVKTQEELFKFLERLGIKRSDRETRGYDTLVYLKNHS